MEKAEKEIDANLKERENEIRNLKKNNLEARIKMAQGEQTDMQIKEMRAKLNKELE